MDNLNHLFYEEFTKLEQICVAIYQMEDGVTDYIAQMSSVSSAYGEIVPNWQTDLQQLYCYHMAYTALAQSSEALREYTSRQEDIDWIQRFCTRIMERTDPLALLQERGYRAEDDAKQRLEDGRTGEIVFQTMNPRDRYVNGPFVVWVILIAVIVTCLVSVFLLSRA